MVKSCYNLLVTTRNARNDLLQGMQRTSNKHLEEKAWTSLWGIRVPSSIKSFLWRLAKVSLPTEDIRQHRNMSQSDCCSLCGMPDSWDHSLLKCSMSRCVWALVDVDIVEVLAANDIPDAKLWLFQIHDALSHEKFIKFAVTIWAIWTARRKAIHESIFQSPMQTQGFIDRFIAEVNLSAHPSVSNSISHVSVPRAHAISIYGGNATLLQERRLILTCQSKLSDDRSKEFAVAICRDQSGLYLGSSAIVFDGACMSETLDALACREA